MKSRSRIFFSQFLLSVLLLTSARFCVAQQSSQKHYLYVAVPGIRDYLGYGGHGILVFDMDNGHRFVKRIETKGFHPDKTPSNVKGIAVSIPLNSIYIKGSKNEQQANFISVSYNYLDVLGIQIKEGRGFSAQFQGDTLTNGIPGGPLEQTIGSVILNETAVNNSGFYK